MWYIIDWVWVQFALRSGGIYQRVCLYLSCIEINLYYKGLTREPMCIVLMGFDYSFVQLVRSNLYNVSLVAHLEVKIYPNILVNVYIF